MKTRSQKTKNGKRWIVFLGAAFCIGLGALMAVVPEGDTSFRSWGKWPISLLLIVGGLGFLGIALRGNPGQIDKTTAKMGEGFWAGW